MCSSDLLVAFRFETGDVVWEKKIGKSTDKFLDLNSNIILFNNLVATSDSAGNIYFINVKNGEIKRQVNTDATTNLILHSNKIYYGSAQGNLKYLNEDYDVVELGKASAHSLTRVGVWREGLISGDIKGEISFHSTNSDQQYERKHLGNDLSAIFTKPEKGTLGGLVLFKIGRAHV